MTRPDLGGSVNRTQGEMKTTILYFRFTAALWQEGWEWATSQKTHRKYTKCVEGWGEPVLLVVVVVVVGRHWLHLRAQPPVVVVVVRLLDHRHRLEHLLDLEVEEWHDISSSGFLIPYFDKFLTSTHNYDTADFVLLALLVDRLHQ